MTERKRKPQVTLQFHDSEKSGDRLYVAGDMGFRDPHWAKIKSKPIIDSMLDLLPLSWIMFTISYAKAVAFTKWLERVFKEKNHPIDYVVIRTTEKGDEGIESWFFIHGLGLADIIDKASSYSDMVPVELHHKSRLVKVLTIVFDYEFHPEKEGSRRFSASRHTMKQLRISRMQQLIRMAREGKGHPIVENLPSMADFVTRLARFIKSDRPLIYNLRLKAIFSILAWIERTKHTITRDEVIAVLLKLLDKREWEREGLYEGLPKHGVERDIKEGRATVYDGEHLALTTQAKEDSDWDLPGEVEVKPGEEYLE